MLVVPQNESIAPYAAIEYSVVCKIDLDTMYVDVETEIVVVWMDNEGQQVTNDTRITIADTQTAAGGGYKSTLTFSPLSLIDNRDYTCSVTIVADDPSPFVTASNPTAHTYTINVTGMSEQLYTASSMRRCMCRILFVHSSTRANSDILNHWFWSCQRASAATMHLPIHPRSL